ncbi:MAG: 23S rRNA (adenine(1618)-N(6))-methyltransferase RlmF [Tannerellaceae bacterium]
MVERNELHPRNKHNGQYDFPKLVEVCPALERFVVRNEYDTLTIDYFNPSAVKALNKALLMAYYGITYWDIPKDYLCPPIPGRADHIHYIADLIGYLPENNQSCRCLDIGVGANCIYPIIGCTEYGWSFVGADINPVAIANSRKIATCNPVLTHRIELRLQPESNSIFKGIIAPDEYFDVTVCNPPFHDSEEQAEQAALRKLSSLKGKKVVKAELNFGGNVKELCCEGGELRFLLNMITESKEFSKNCGWFTTYVSKEKNLSRLYAKLKAVQATEYKTIDMKQGTKSSRILAWRFL